MTSLGRLLFNDIQATDGQNVSSSSSTLRTVDDNLTLNLSNQNLHFMPINLIETWGSTVKTLDISYNKFSRNFYFLKEFENLKTLKLDGNNIDTHSKFPYLPKLEVLWITKNKINDLYPFLKNLYESFPNLQYLCLMGNPGVPSYHQGDSFYDYLQYRLFVISWFPKLLQLDDRVINSEQREEARRLYRRPFFEELSNKVPLPKCIKAFSRTMFEIFIKPVSFPNRFRSFRNTNLII